MDLVVPTVKLDKEPVLFVETEIGDFEFRNYKHYCFKDNVLTIRFHDDGIVSFKDIKINSLIGV